MVSNFSPTDNQTAILAVTDTSPLKSLSSTYQLVNKSFLRFPSDNIINMEDLAQTSAIEPEDLASQLLSRSLSSELSILDSETRDPTYKVKGNILLVEKGDNYLLSRAKKALKNVITVSADC